MAPSVCAQCGVEIPPRARPGNQRRYCSGRCRTEASRDRQALAVYEPETLKPVAVVAAQAREELLQVAESIIVEDAQAPATDRLARAIVETRVLSTGYARLAPELPPGLAWRAADMSSTLDAEVSRLFGRPDDES